MILKTIFIVEKFGRITDITTQSINELADSESKPKVSGRSMEIISEERNIRSVFLLGEQGLCVVLYIRNVWSW